MDESNFHKFRRLIDLLPDYEQGNFTSRIIAEFEEKHPMEFRDAMNEAYRAVTERGSDGRIKHQCVEGSDGQE